MNLRGPSRAALGALALSVLGLRGGADDPLAAEIERWRAFAADSRSTEEMWLQVKAATAPQLEGASRALADGRRLLALQRLASARANLAAAAYLGEQPASTRDDPAAFEAEWKRMGAVLAADLAPPRPGALDGVRPAAVRALGETALPQVREYYETGLDYVRNTMPKYGLFYIGVARGQRDFVAFARTLSEVSGKNPPALRPLGPDLDALEDAMLSAYRPPAAIDRHADFIAASAALKEARELDAAGLRYGALYKYLQAAQRFSSAAPDAALAGRLAAFEARLSSGATDHSIGRLYLEIAQADLDASKGGAPASAAAAIASDVLPRYFAALGPAPAAPPRPPAEVTVTLVRWPYT